MAWHAAQCNKTQLTLVLKTITRGMVILLTCCATDEMNVIHFEFKGEAATAGATPPPPRFAAALQIKNDDNGSNK